MPSEPAQAGLFGREGVGEVRDARDRHFTPDPLAALIVERAALFFETGPAVVIEPSVGGGAFARAARKQWPGNGHQRAPVYIIGVDIDPDAEGLEHCDEAIVGDWPEVAAAVGKRASRLARKAVGQVLVLGNPPFSGKTDLQLEQAIAHVQACWAAGDTTCLILPWGPLGGVDQWAPIMHGHNAPLHAWPFSPRPWGEHVREAAAYLWRSEGNPFDVGTVVKWLARWKP